MRLAPLPPQYLARHTVGPMPDPYGHITAPPTQVLHYIKIGRATHMPQGRSTRATHHHYRSAGRRAVCVHGVCH